jgi:hypothetical protein
LLPSLHGPLHSDEKKSLNEPDYSGGTTTSEKLQQNTKIVLLTPQVEIFRQIKEISPHATSLLKKILLAPPNVHCRRAFPKDMYRGLRHLITDWVFRLPNNLFLHQILFCRE